MTTNQILAWIKANLGPQIRQAIADSGYTTYTEDWIGAMTMQETGFLIAKLIGEGYSVPILFSHLKGDYSQRPGDAAVVPHGFGPIQIDLGSFPGFIASGDWQDPYKCYMQALKILEGDRLYLLHHYPFKQIQTDEDLAKATTAAYNCGADLQHTSILTRHMSGNTEQFINRYHKYQFSDSAVLHFYAGLFYFTKIKNKFVWYL